MGDSYQIKNQSGMYFLTFQVVGWVDIFSRQLYRDLIIDSLKFCIENKGLEIFGYVIMTNHVHLIARSKNGNLSDIVRDLKRFTSRNIMRDVLENDKESRKDWLNVVFEYHGKYNRRVETKQFWTHHNHAVELTSNEMMDVKLQYIHENPVRAGWVEEPEHYLYSSARNYAGLSIQLKIEMIT